jgi:hypothetical protein
MTKQTFIISRGYEIAEFPLLVETKDDIESNDYNVLCKGDIFKKIPTVSRVYLPKGWKITLKPKKRLISRGLIIKEEIYEGKGMEDPIIISLSASYNGNDDKGIFKVSKHQVMAKIIVNKL